MPAKSEILTAATPLRAASRSEERRGEKITERTAKRESERGKEERERRQCALLRN